jgi:hypothetical protein
MKRESMRYFLGACATCCVSNPALYVVSSLAFVSGYFLGACATYKSIYFGCQLFKMIDIKNRLFLCQ